MWKLRPEQKATDANTSASEKGIGDLVLEGLGCISGN